MDKSEKYFQNITSRERAIFEGGITMGAIFHQFVGTPVSLKSVESLEKAIQDAMELQPCIDEVEVNIDREMIAHVIGEFEYISLSGEMLDVRVVSVYNKKRAVTRICYIEELHYPLMFLEEVD